MAELPMSVLYYTSMRGLRCTDRYYILAPALSEGACISAMAASPGIG